MTIREAIKLGAGFYIGYEFAKDLDRVLEKRATRYLKDHDFENEFLKKLKNAVTSEEIKENKKKKDVVIMGFRAE